MRNKLPKISFIVPTFNEEKNIKKCLESIFFQDYPKSKIEVLVVDDDSTDKTVQIAKKYPVKILRNGKHHGEIGKMIGFKKATGDYAMYLDADVELRGKKWIKKMIVPLQCDNEIIGAFTGKYFKKSYPPLERYMTFDPLQRDSIYQYFSPSIDEVVEEKTDDYWKLNYQVDNIPPAGRCLYRRKKILSLVGGYEMFLELDFLVLLTKAGYNKFAYVPDAGLYHHHVRNLSELMRKRWYNLNKVYLGRNERLYTWFDLRSVRGVLKIIIWVVYANLLLPSVLVGIYKSIKFKDIAGMFEPIVNIMITDLILFGFLKNEKFYKLLRS